MQSPRHSLPLGLLAIVVAAAGVVVSIEARGDENQRVGPPVQGVNTPVEFRGAEAAIRLFAPKLARQVNPAEGIDGPVQPAGDDPRTPVKRGLLRKQVQNLDGIVIVPAVEAPAFQRRFVIMGGGRGQFVAAAGPRGRDAWISSILRTTDPETAREYAQRRLDDRLDVLSKGFNLTSEQREKLQLAGEGDISRFLAECEAVVGEALAIEAAMPEDDQANTAPLWRRCSELRSQLVAGLHDRGSLFRKQWEASVGDSRIDPMPTESEMTPHHFFDPPPRIVN